MGIISHLKIVFLYGPLIVSEKMYSNDWQPGLPK